MNAPALARQLAIGRIALGGALVLTPGLAARGWIGRVSGTPGARALARGFGMRDVAIGAGVLNALSAGKPAADWLLAGALGDVADLAATLAAGRDLPPLGRYGIVALAAGGAGLSVLAARGLAAPQPTP
jgi:hypothetical protein